MPAILRKKLNEARNSLVKDFAEYEKLRSKIQDERDHKKELEAEVESFLNSTEMPEEKAFDLVSIKRAKAEFLGKLIIAHERDAGMRIDLILAKADATRSAIRDAMDEEKDEVIDKIAAVLKPFNHPRTEGETMDPSRRAALYCSVIQFFDPAFVMSISLAPLHGRDNNPAHFDNVVSTAVREISAFLDQYAANGNSFVPKDFGK